MKKYPFCNFLLAGVSLTDYGLEIPSPFSSLTLSNSEINSFTSWSLKCIVGGDANKKVNVAAFEALLYSAAQAADGYKNASGIPVSFMFGWLTPDGSVGEYVSYQGFTLKFNVGTTGLYMTYNIEGYASLAMQSSTPVLRIPELCGIVQPSAVVEAVAKGVKADNYYDLDIDHNDAPTLINHAPLTTSFNSYIRGSFDGTDNYDSFPGLLKLSKSYNMSRDAGGIKRPYKSLKQVLDCTSVTPVSSCLKQSLTDNTPQCSSFSYWVDEPTMTQRGTIHYKSNAGLSATNFSDTLEYGTANTNIININGSYNGVAYNMTDMRFSQVGFALDVSGNAIMDASSVVNSWASSLTDVFQTANIINDINALASQFAGNFTIDIPGSVKKYTIAQPISLVVMSQNTLSPVTGIYNIISVSHTVSNSFVTTLKVQRLVTSSANQVATSQGILLNSGSSYGQSFTTTPNVKSPYKVDFGEMYPDFTHLFTI